MKALAVASDASGPRVRMIARKYGVIVKVLGLVRLVREDYMEALEKALAARPRYIIVTSRFGARLLSEHLAMSPSGSLYALGSTIIAVGPSTAEELGRLGLPVGFVPKEHSTEGVLKEFRFEPGSTAVTIRPRDAPWALEEGLKRMGVSAIRVSAYSEYCGARRLRRDEAGYSTNVIIGSAREARCLYESLRLTGLSPSGFTAHCIGPFTASEARTLGFKVGVVAKAYTFEGLFEALREVGGGS